MKIQYQGYGAIANIVTTSMMFEFRGHNQVVDAILFCTPDIIVTCTGVFFTKAALLGKSRDVLRTYKIARWKAAR